MLTINSIKDGIVIDHITAGCGVEIFNYMGLDKVDFPVALIMNVDSKKLGKKDIIKIENIIDIDYTVLGLIDPNITIDVIEKEVRKEKKKLEMPERVENVIKCKNPRCITSIEHDVLQIFHLVNGKTGEYKCEYCDEINTLGR